MKNSWWWTEELSETCRVLFQNKFEKLVHLVGVIMRIDILILMLHTQLLARSIHIHYGLKKPCLLTFSHRQSQVQFNFHKSCYHWQHRYTGCIKMIGAVLKLIIFTSMVNRIINTSRYERVTQQVYDTYPSLLNCRRNAHWTETTDSCFTNCSTQNAFCYWVAIIVLFPHRPREKRGVGLRMRTKLEQMQFHSIWET